MNLKQKYSILFTLGGLSALAPLSIDMYLPAFGQIAGDLSTDIAQVSFSLTSYFIGITLGQLIYGPLTDKFGRKKPLLVGLCIFFVSSLGCAFSPSVFWLISLRTILAFGGCAAMVTSTASVQDLFDQSEVAKIFSILMLILGIAPIVGPTLGGVILTITNWHFIFYFLSFFSLVLITLVYLFLPELDVLKNKKSLTLSNIIRDYKFVVTQDNFLFYALATATAMSGMFAYISGSPFVFIQYFKFTEVQYSLIFAFNAVGFIVGSQLNRVLLNKYCSVEIIYAGGLMLLSVSVILVVLLMANLLNAIFLIAVIFIFLFSLGLLIPNCTAGAVSNFTINAGIASAVVGAFQMFLSAISSWLVNFLNNGSIEPMVFGIFCPSIFCSVILFLLWRKNKKLQRIQS
jgi:DHA1 family bicyclomycin/chloramphenicol resistance-like MFS transporter